jgi:hypothetical protein
MLLSTSTQENNSGGPLLAHDVGAAGVDGRYTLKPENPSASPLTHQVARSLSAVWRAAVVAETLMQRHNLECRDDRFLCPPEFASLFVGS